MKTVYEIKKFPTNKPCPICGGFNLSEDGGLGIMCYDCDKFVYNWGANFEGLENPYSTKWDAWEDVTPWYLRVINKVLGSFK